MEGSEKNFVYISADRGVPFLHSYLSTKREVESWLEKNRDKVKSSVVRPGFMYDDSDQIRRALSYPIELLSYKNCIFDALG